MQLRIFVLLSCLWSLFAYSEQTVSLDISYRLSQASWFSLDGYDKENDEWYLKYSGPMSTYTAKHIPIAVNGGGTEYFTFSKNHKYFLEIMVGDSLGNLTLLEVRDTIDPHDNAVINYWDGYIWVVVSGRGTVRQGTAYRSKYKDDISEFIKIEQGDWTYPQLWKNALLYTRYNDWKRELHARNKFCDKKLVEGGHYSVSYDDGEWIHLAYNWLENVGSNSRKNLYYMKSQDGCTWYDIDGNELILPLADNDNRTIIAETDLLYLKDITVVDGEVSILAIESNSFYPNKGRRNLYRYTKSNRTYIAKVGHNFNTGAFVDGFIVTPTYGTINYAGGDLSVYDFYGNRLHKGNLNYVYNYVRKVFKGQGAYVSEAKTSLYRTKAYIRRLGIKKTNQED